MQETQIPITQIDETPKAVEPSVWKNLFTQGVWTNNSTLVQLLGLCPLLAVSNNVTNALGLGLATLLVLTITNTIISLFRKVIPHDIRIPIYVMIIATAVTTIQLLMNAFAFPVYQSLGIFVPLIVTNCIVIGRAEAFASKNSVAHSAFDGFAMGLGMTLSLVVLGAIREIIGNGTLFDGLDLLLGSWAKALRMDLLHLDSGLLLAILPPGAFIGLGLILAVKNIIDRKK
ncbi:electron transport complex subunit E [Glaesserella parasuis]|uniref:Ion-translocating oxidoreductase complex subunit E n=1 Tax=Glaesserella parasuis serovar 5 (strain SH0165) TaxID=557723 RepID=RNFE_GLAP5|nr:electron transport complex subunit E [Glaesserella parasuis]B8F7B0.1 RecName: Full=Ion-translocating oxidoreductase complex subunit E; AltName: Full=Rnf electron transport complex subunit E [Glaesserella parasuis SH0165]ACL33212.1 electron transport complex protein RnfE/SoxR-reducing system protein RsxE [Glaesserella parasuis SH0165]MDG6281945.1 electron transport complex subunit E [Glaesserella parasuis]MDG6305350.1 electron transport complex subunit E [Glaesserella parasuis]MDG6311969.1 e